MPRKPNLNGQKKALEMRLAGTQVKTIARELGVSQGTVGCWTKGKLPDGYDRTFLDQDGELRSYFLGLFVADGWLSGRGAFVALNDRQLIEKIAEATHYRRKISCIPLRKYGTKELSGRFSYRLNYAREPLMVLRSLGFDNRKTGHEFIPKGIGDTSLPHFLRGLSDGDGSFTFIKNKNRRYLQWSLISASETFLQEILKHLKQIGVASPSTRVFARKTDTGKSAYRLSFGHWDSVAMGSYIYSSATLLLTRKHDVWQQGTSLPSLHHHPWSIPEIELVKQGICPAGRSKAACYAKRATF